MSRFMFRLVARLVAPSHPRVPHCQHKLQAQVTAKIWAGAVECLHVGREASACRWYIKSCNSTQPFARQMAICCRAPAEQFISPSMARQPERPRTSSAVMGSRSASCSTVALGYVGPLGGKHAVAATISRPKALAADMRTLPLSNSPEGHAHGI